MLYTTKTIDFQVIYFKILQNQIFYQGATGFLLRFLKIWFFLTFFRIKFNIWQKKVFNSVKVFENR